MEDGLRVISYFTIGQQKNVLILVVVEDGLRVRARFLIGAYTGMS